MEGAYARQTIKEFDDKLKLSEEKFMIQVNDDVLK